MHLEFQPCSIWTPADQDSDQHTTSQGKLRSLIFQRIAVKVVRDCKDAKLKTSELEFPSLKDGSKVQIIKQKIQALGETISIIENNKKKVDMIKKF
ncbi:hypothetical protein CLU79DRAFT_155080, partial [Phycomyces nitens]